MVLAGMSFSRKVKMAPAWDFWINIILVNGQEFRGKTEEKEKVFIVELPENPSKLILTLTFD